LHFYSTEKQLQLLNYYTFLPAYQFTSLPAYQLTSLPAYQLTNSIGKDFFKCRIFSNETTLSKQAYTKMVECILEI
jgi:hypothetical protein